MVSRRLLAGLAALVLSAGTLALIHGCEDTSQPAEPRAAVAAILKTMTVTGSGTGNGVVTSSPAGINCTITAGVAAASGCHAQFNSTTRVTLTAKPRIGHSFLGWFQTCSGTGTCTIGMSVNRTVQARFLKGPFTIKISSGTSGVGTGRVRSQTGLSPAINCLITNGTPAATGCAATYPAYTTLTLTATPSAGFVFAGWKEPSCGTGSCQFTIIQGRTILATFARPGSSNPVSQGRWEPVFSTPVVAVHVHLLRTGKVLLWGDMGDAQLWNPANPSAGFIAIPKTTNHRIYCSGHTFAADGRLLVAGGTSPGTRGLRVVELFIPGSSNWGATESMAQGRYYPTTTTLPNGEILVVSGQDTNKAVVTIPEIWNGSSWRRLTSAPLSIPNPFYPPMFVAPNGKAFYAGWTSPTRYLDISGTGQWTTVAFRNAPDRKLGSAVMYGPGKVLYTGGGDTTQVPIATAEVIDLNQGSPSWRAIQSMAFPRRQTNATLLADGTVLVTGGTSGVGFNNQAGAVHAAERWDPKSETWTTMAREARNRTYHATAILLPDARVLSSGSGEGGGIPFQNSEFSAQIFTPPYLFSSDGGLAPRPTISLAPSALSYGQVFTVETPNAVSATRGTLIRLSSVTHSFNQSQALYPLTFSQVSSNTLQATAPPNANVAPPGPYMLFLLNELGVPSLAKFVMVGS
ncbi:MAG: galactose oxidase-like domain-containing protein [Gemmatimonadales bacterium]